MTRREELPLVGWREWVELPDLGVAAIKAKVDTGARSSSLHVFDLESFQRGGQAFVRFGISPLQRTTFGRVEAAAEVLEYRKVKSSTGHTHERPVVVTTMALLGRSWPIERTPARRDQTGCRLLLGREAVRTDSSWTRGAPTTEGGRRGRPGGIPRPGGSAPDRAYGDGRGVADGVLLGVRLNVDF